MSSSSTVSLSLPRALARLLPFVAPAKWWLLAGFLVALLGSVASLAIPLVLQAVVDGPLVSGDQSAIVWGVAAVLGLGILEALFIFLRRRFVLRPMTEVEFSIRQTFYERLQRLPVALHDRWQSGQLLSRMMQDIGLIRRWLTFGLIMLVVNVLTMLVGIGLLFRWHWALGTVFFICSLPIWIVAYRFEQKYGVLSRMSQDQSGDLATAVEESVHGIRVLKAFGRGAHSLAKFRERAETLRGTELRKAREVGLIWFWYDLVPFLALGACLFTGIVLASRGELTVGELFGFFALAAAVRWPMNSLGFLFSFMIDARTATDRVFEVFDAPITIADPEQPQTIEHPRGELAFRGVHFRFGDAREHERDLVNGLDLVLQPGETMALVGATGSGKTTLTALPTRLYDVTAGAVELDGVDVRNLTLEELRRRIGIAFEDPILFSASVRDNVLLGREDLDPASEEAEAVLREALGVAQAGFAYDLPDGLDTEVGEEGMSLSGGQRQRLALARVVAAKPDVLVLDDPLSALDVDTEAQVEAALRRVLATTTALIVAHRPSTVSMADRVAVMQAGRVIAVGTHSELLASNEHYRHLISSLEPDTDTDTAKEVAR
ncbi:ABC transporter ATP-binding protein [Leucobacter sp. cx-42]|uniref:ABC transporter ATP-binding protein n=1 Tax=unclassified Leucobacter TaxID=2621730 RepID=UPI00165DA5A8|nr:MULTISPECIES: ABC transporter ATP-binding protein [unclassified Leucobacter]MBC9954440.1 ABC transporter ATP-binding protein [Leucobacter sp. cx-42]